MVCSVLMMFSLPHVQLLQLLRSSCVPSIQQESFPFLDFVTSFPRLALAAHRNVANIVFLALRL